MKNAPRLILLVLAALSLSFTFARAELLYVSTGSTIAQFDSANPGVTSSVNITGLQGSLVGIDRRPANGLIYGITTSNLLYTINPTTGVATQVGSAGGFTLSGNNFGIDFNPVPDRIRVVSDAEQNIRINPNDGTLAGTDTNLSPAGNVVAAAYTNNFNGATQTTLYAIDSASGNLVLIGSPNGTPNSPNTGLVTVVGSLGLGSVFPFIGFDISGATGVAYAVITIGLSQLTDHLEGVATSTRLYSINLTTGAATLVGPIGNGNTVYSGLTAATAIPEPSSVMLLGVGAAGLIALARRSRRSQV